MIGLKSKLILTVGRGSCSSWHQGRTCPICHDYCLQKRPSGCVQCKKQRPTRYRVALWCTQCYSPEDIALQLCQSCHPNTGAPPDAPVSTHEEEEKQLNDILLTLPRITGDEPALQQHVLLSQYFPDKVESSNMPATLPQYSPRPQHMSPIHCRLCLQRCPGEDAESVPASLENPSECGGVHPAVLQHALEHHGLRDADAYRRAVFTRVQRGFPEPVTAQVMRMAQERCTDRCSDANFAKQKKTK